MEVFREGEKVETIKIGMRAVITFGRNEHVCDIGLAHQSISRQHAVVVHDKQGHVQLMDLGSTHGTGSVSLASSLFNAFLESFLLSIHSLLLRNLNLNLLHRRIGTFVNGKRLEANVAQILKGLGYFSING